MRPIENVPEEDRATDIGNTPNKFGKDRACGYGDILSDSTHAIHCNKILITYLAVCITAATGNI